MISIAALTVILLLVAVSHVVSLYFTAPEMLGRFHKFAIFKLYDQSLLDVIENTYIYYATWANISLVWY